MRFILDTIHELVHFVFRWRRENGNVSTQPASLGGWRRSCVVTIAVLCGPITSVIVANVANADDGKAGGSQSLESNSE